MVRPISFAAALAAGVMATHPATAYQLRGKQPNHERLTALSEECFQTFQGQFPVQCRDLPDSARAFKNVSWSTNDPHSLASRWSDNPTRQLYGTGSLKFIVMMGLGRCESVIEQFKPGLLCHSHAGELQFLHAMKNGSESFAETTAKIENWSRFAYQAATTMPLDTEICPLGSGAFPALGGAFAALDFSSCGAHEGNRWTVRHLFGFRCSNAFWSGKCGVIENGREVRLAALGSLIHLIQDSYSQAHNARGGNFPVGPYAARVTCQPVVAYYDYGPQSVSVHDKADVAPVFDTGCGEGSATLDPVTAVARLKWLVANGCDSTWVAELIARNVMVRRDDSRLPASPQACRAPKQPV